MNKRTLLLFWAFMLGFLVVAGNVQAQSTSFIGKFQLDGPVGETRTYYFTIPESAEADVGYQTRGNTSSAAKLYNADTGTLLKELAAGLGGTGKKAFGTLGAGNYYIEATITPGVQLLGNAEVYFEFASPVVPVLSKEVELDWDVNEVTPEIKVELKNVAFLEDVYPVKCPQADYAIYDPEGNLVSKATNEETSYQSFNLVYPLSGVWTVKISNIVTKTPYNPMKFMYSGGSVRVLGAAEEVTPEKPEPTVTKTEEPEKVVLDETAPPAPPSFPWWWLPPIFLGFLLILLLVVLLMRGKKQEDPVQKDKSDLP